ncbi:MAG: redoxin domain-containing protein [Chloroflexia bacterium]|nr:redoxin domain-containing protein [Chloroflexia bacterium]
MSHPETALAAGTPAPDFTLRATPDQSVSLSELRGHPVVLVFYPADWSPVCTDELAVFNQLLPEFQRMGAIVLGISVDGVWSHAAFADARNLQFQLLSDFEPKGKVARAYGVYREKEGSCARATFVVDKDGVIAWSEVSPAGINPGAAGPLAAVEKLTGQTAGATV